MASKIELYTYQGIIERIVDADTLIVMVDLGFDTFKRVRCRLLDLSAPEKGTELGDRITEDLKSFLGLNCLVYSKKLDRYGRSLSNIKIADLDLATHIKAKYPETITASGFRINDKK
jgi:hypothetical protein